MSSEFIRISCEGSLVHWAKLAIRDMYIILLLPYYSSNTAQTVGINCGLEEVTFKMLQTLATFIRG